MSREAVVAAARSWVGTPYHHRARVKGAGVDCGQLLMEVFVEAGVVERYDPGFYTCDWHLHRGEERYLEVVEQFCDPIDADEETIDWRIIANPSFRAEPGDIVVFRVGRTFSHGGIVTEWPRMVHAYMAAEVVEEVSLLNTPMSARPMKVYRIKGGLR